MEILFALGVIAAFLIGMCVQGGINVNINVNKSGEGLVLKTDDDGNPIYNESIDNLTKEQRDYFHENNGQYRI